MTEAHLRELYSQAEPMKYPGFKNGNDISKFFLTGWADNSQKSVRPGIVPNLNEGSIFEVIYNNQDNAFIGLRITFSETHYAARFFTTIFFYIGLIFISTVLIQNILFVLEQI